MEEFEDKYEDAWELRGSVLMYVRPDFQYKPHVIITELDDCLVSKATPKKIYNTWFDFKFEIYADDLIKRLTHDMTEEKSVVVISNQINSNKLNVDMIKRKFEAVLKEYNFPVIALFALKANAFSKPHTGLWRLLNHIFECKITKAEVVSNQGGLLIEDKKGNPKVISNDIDRAFAHNIGAKYYTIDEYLGFDEPIDYTWDKAVISPEIRRLYVESIKDQQKKNPKIVPILREFQQDTYMIVVQGAPRCGKTTFSNDFVKKWNSQAYAQNHAIKILSTHKWTHARRLKQTMKLLDDRISVIIDGCDGTEYLKQYVIAAKERNLKTLIIDIYCGINMAKVLNHVAVETSTDDNVYLQKNRDYDIYESLYRAPKNSEWVKCVRYMPLIKESPVVLDYRY